MSFILTSFISLAKIEQEDKRKLSSRVEVVCLGCTLTQSIVFSDRKNKASAALGLALFMCFVAEDSLVRNISSA